MQAPPHSKCAKMKMLLEGICWFPKFMECLDCAASMVEHSVIEPQM